MDLSDLYYQKLLSLILKEYEHEFKDAQPGHCMKITGLAIKELQALCSSIRSLSTPMKTYILSEDEKGGEYITATKLIELRNNLTFPLLVLIPSNSKASAEDSYGNATFKNLDIQHLDEKMFKELLNEIPVKIKPAVTEIFDYLNNHNLRAIQYIYYLLFLQEQLWEVPAVGDGLNFLSLIPDSNIAEHYGQIRQRLLYNIKSIEALGNYSRTIPDRIKELPILPNTNQREIGQFLNTENELKNRKEICDIIASKYPSLNFSFWKIPEIKDVNEVKVFVEKITSKDLKIDDGDLMLTIPAGSSSKVKIRVTTKPSPKDFKDLKGFRIVLMAIDGWYQVADVKLAKATENAKPYRDITMELSEAMFNEGSYFFRVFAEDENGSILNQNDSFNSASMQELWEKYKQHDSSAIKDDFANQHNAKFTSDSEDFYLNFNEQEDGGEDANPRRKDKVSNVLQAFFKYTIEALRNGDDLTIPSPIEDTGVWLNEGHAGLIGTYHIKYATNHNYQINIPNKLVKLESCFLNNLTDLGRVEAIVSPNVNDNQLRSLRFIAFPLKSLVPQKLLNLRKEFFSLIIKSAPDDTGIFETFDLFNHIETAKAYVTEYQNWIAQSKEMQKGKSQDMDNSTSNLTTLLQEIQNIDVISVKTELPDGQSVYFKSISPLHPLRLAWFINLFDLYKNWEEKTVLNPSYKGSWYKKLENLFLGDLIPEVSLPVISDVKGGDYLQYVGELFFGWGMYTKPMFKANDVFSSFSRQMKIYLSTLLNIANEYRIDTDVNQNIIERHINNYLSQHPYIEKLVINLFNAGDAYAFTNALISLESQIAYKSVKYEIRLFSDDQVILPGEALRNLINPESNISEDAEAFSQASGNRLFPKLRFSINQLSDFVSNANNFHAHISFLISPFPVKTTLIHPGVDKKSFYFNGLITRQIINVKEKGAELIWDKYFVGNRQLNNEDLFCNIGIDLFSGLQILVADSLSNGTDHSVPSTRLELKEPDKVLLSFIHDTSDWVVTFDRNMGPEVYDLPREDKEIPFLLDYVPGQEVSGISSFLTTRPTSEIIGLLGPHFAEYGIDFRNNESILKILLEDIRTISSSLILQFNSTQNKAFEVLGTAFTKRVLEKKDILRDAFLIPIDLHRELFYDLPGEIKDRADTLLVKINEQNRIITFTVIEIKCRTTLTENVKLELIEKMSQQIDNTIEAIRFHFDSEYNSANDRLDRELKNLELKSFLEFYANRSARYNQLSQDVLSDYLSFLNNLESGYSLNFKKLGIIYDFSADYRHKKESYSADNTFFTFGKDLISEILDPNSDLNTKRLEHKEEDERFYSFFESHESNPANLDLTTANEKNETYQTSNSLPDLKTNTAVVENASDLIVKKDESSFQNEPTISPSERINNEILNGDNSRYPSYDIMIGKSSDSSQYGILGKMLLNKKTIALDLSETNTISLFGVQGGGKSYSIGSITEMVLKQFNYINKLPAPLASVIFHYSESMDYEPEFTSMICPNDKQSEINKLKAEFGAEPGKLDDVVILTSQDKIAERKAQYPSIDVLPISFNSNELNVQDWMFLLGAIGNDSTYIKQLRAIMKRIRRSISLQALRDAVRDSNSLSNTQKTLAEQRIDFASEYINDKFNLREILKPGRLIIVDLRDEFIEKDEALGLFVVMLNIFSSIKVLDSKPFNKFIVFDEAHKYMDNRELTDSIETAIREMRHKGVSIMIASQDPLSLPNEIIALSSIVLLHKFNSPQWIKHIQKSITQLGSLSSGDLASLLPGEGYLWSNKSTDKGIMSKPVKIYTRPRVTQHGGETVKAI
jgi:DNA phosphorothioation-dependent restriction protein DptH